MGSGSDSVAATTSTSAAASPNVKRSRDPEDEVYLDNLRSHKRYLSEVGPSWFLVFHTPPRL